MGSNKSKQKKQINPFVKNYPPRPIIIYHIENSDSKSTTAYQPAMKSKPAREYILPKEIVKTFPKRLPQRDKLYNPNSKRPLELSWLHQSDTNDTYKRINHHYHTLHDHRIPIAIHRWPKTDNKFEKSISKSFTEEYIYQKRTTF